MSRLWDEIDENFMSMALEEARQAPDRGEVPIGAVLVYEGEVLARAHNLKETLNDPTAHAELLVLKEAARRLGQWRLTGAHLYVTMEPCSMCAGAMIQSRISRLVFGVRDAKAGACGSVFNIPQEPRLNHRVEVIHGTHEQEIQELLQGFFNRLRSRVERTIVTGEIAEH
jgi:tRNA(adenine34) deaminase